MSGYEYAMVIASLGGILFSLFVRRIQSNYRIPVMLAVTGILAVNVVVEGYKWKWIPLYVLILMFLLWNIVSVARNNRDDTAPKRKGIRLTAGALALVFWGIACMLGAYLFPAIAIPSPTGPHEIGTVSFEWQDDERQETFTDEADDHRKVIVRLWYPAEETKGLIKATYGFDPKQVDLSRDAPFFYRVIGQSNQKAESHAFADAPLSAAEAAYPLILFSPGYGGSNYMYAAYVEELASHGYIVASIQHPYFTLFPTEFLDGSMANGMHAFGGAGDWEQSEALINQILVKDVQFVIDQLEGLNRNDSSHRFTNRMDLSRLGMLGHSFGGTVAAQVIHTDDRVKAGINMDGFLYGSKLNEGLSGPFMYMATGATARFEKMELEQKEWETYGISSEEDYGQIAGEQAERHKLLLQNGGYDVTFHDANHYDFSDAPVYSPLIGSGNSRQHFEQTNRLIRAFFDKHLNERESPELESSSSNVYSIEAISFK